MLNHTRPLGSCANLRRSVHHARLPVTFTFESNRASDVLRQEGISDREPHEPQRDPGGKRDEDLTDREWDLRVGHAIHHLRTTLPSFFEAGLIIHPTPFINPPSAGPELLHPSRQVYSPNVRLSYTPPFPLPPPFPRTLHIEGLTLYSASSSIVRHTMSAFYSDLGVELRRMNVLSPGRRERAVRICLGVYGWGRMTDARAEWDVNSTYTFSPTTALISHHRIESIDPAPHISVYNGLRASLQRFLRPDVEPQPEPKRAFDPSRIWRDREGHS